MTRWMFAGALVGACLAGAVPAIADEVLFKNGDKLTGKVVDYDGKKVTIDSKVAGKVSVDMKDVQTFTTDEPITIRLQDGSTIRDRVVGAEEGTVQTAGAGNVAAQPVPLASVKAINPKEKWTGAVVVGGFLARGNTNSESLNITLDATRRREDDRISFAGGYFFQRQESSDGQKETSIDNWFAQGKYDYFFTEKFYGYGLFRVERDRIADLDLRLAPSVGVGYQWIESERQNFSTEAGIGWVYEEYDPGGTDEHIAGRLAYHYDQTINDKVKFFHNFEYLPSLEDFGDYNLRADVGIRADLTARMFTEFKIEWLYDSTPAPGNSENDLRYILGVGWAF